MRSLFLYKQLNGVPRRLLSVSAKLRGPGGEFHESDDAVPREFIEAAYILSEDQRPNPMVLQQKDMTPELIAEKAKKYNILPEDYVPMSITYGGAYGGDYPTIVDDANYNRNFNYEWDNFDLKKNYGSVIGMHEWSHYGAFPQFYDGQFHPYGLWQYKQHWWLYMKWVAFLVSGYFIHYWVSGQIGTMHSSDRFRLALENTSLHKDRSWSKTELEWLDVFLKVEQAKDGYANRSHADHDASFYRISSIWFSKFGQYCGRFRRGPTGESPMMMEKSDTYMCPAGPMSFKMGHNMPVVHPKFMEWNHPHPSHGKGTEMADMLSTEIASDY